MGAPTGRPIETLDNPGWLVTVDLAGTPLASRPFTGVADGFGAGAHPNAPRWVHCSVQDGAWRGAGDGTQLARLLGLFLDWADEDTEPDAAANPTEAADR